MLLTEYKGGMSKVIAAYSSRPYVAINGKRVLAQGTKLRLAKTNELRPTFVKVRNVRVNSSTLVDESGSEMNNEFHFQASLEAPSTLEDVFIVLDISEASGGRYLFLYEVGRLEARRIRTTTLNGEIPFPLGEGRYTVHLFSEGLELLHSEQQFGMRESMLDKLVAEKVKTLPDGPPSLFAGPTPDRPGKRRKDTPPGKVVVKMRIRANGTVREPTVVEASDPALAEAALAAVRFWRFLPQIKEGQAVETITSIPIEFPGGEEPKKTKA